MARYTHMPTFVAEQFLLQVSHIGHVLSGCREKTQLQLLWLGHHLAEELIMGEDGVWERESGRMRYSVAPQVAGEEINVDERKGG